MLEELRPVSRPPLLHVTVQEAIRAYILNNRLQAGDPLPPEGELAQRLDVSRTSIREAVKALESLGILETRRGSGIFVRNFSFEPLLNNLHYGLLFDLKELAELLRVRCILEQGMLEDAMAAMSEAQIAKLQNALDEMHERARHGERFPREDRLFHYYLFEHLGNQTFLKIADVFWLVFHKALENNLFSQEGDPMPTYRNHVAILDAIRGGNVEDVRVALDKHYGGLEHFLRNHQPKV